MPQLILAIEPDRRQASRIAAIARNFLEAELVVSESVEEALGTLKTRIPDLVLTPLLLSPKDENALDDRLRQLDAAGTKVQTLVTPMLAAATARKPSQKTGLLTRLRKTRSAAIPDGCEPSVFAAQITEYLDRVLAERRAAAETLRDNQRAAAREARNAPQDVPPATLVSESVEDVAAPPAAAIMGEPAASLNDADPFVRTVIDDAIAEVLAVPTVEPVETYTALAQEPDPPAIAAERIPEAATMAAPPPRTMRESVLAAFTRLKVEPPPVPDFGVTEAAAIPDFSVVEAEEQPAVTAARVTEAASPADLVSASADATVLHDAALAAEVAAILGTTVEEIVPSEIAGDQAAVSAPLAGFHISLEDEGWESIELEAVEAVGDHPPARRAATPDPLIATPVTLVATPEPVHTTRAPAAPVPQPAAAAASVSEPADAAVSQPAGNAPRHKLRGANRNAFVARIEARLAQLGKGLLPPTVAAPKPAPVKEPFEDEPEPSADDYDPKVDLWMPLAMGSHTEWPRLAMAISVMPAPASIAPVEIEPAHPSKRLAGRKKKAAAAPKPAQDEWGLFDPQQCGFAALLAKLDEVTDVPSE